jgi:membrane associated rhomboid family serine protease
VRTGPRDTTADAGDGREELVEVAASPRTGGCRELALVLLAVGIPHELVEGAGGSRLLVPASRLAASRDQLARFAAENRAGRRVDDALEPRSHPGAGVAAWVAVLGVAFVCERMQSLGLDWWGAGLADASRIRAGAWWRALTALTLHDDFAHLAGNLVFGALFVGALCPVAGTGLALAAVLLSGTLGNLLNAALQPDGHRSLGASTAVFGALGLLAALQWRRRARRRSGALRRWTPVVAALLLLGYLGASGVRVDVLAHVTGLLCGLALGVALEPGLDGPLARPGVQRLLGSAALALVLVAWTAAFLAPA